MQEMLNKIILGDCLYVMKDIPDKSVDMILCDLPYGTTACKWDTIIPFDKLWEQYNRIIKDNGAIVLFGSEPFSSKLRMSNLKMYKYDWVWIKDKPSNFLMGKKQPLRYTENVIIFGGKIYNPQMQIRDKNNKRHNNLDKSLLKNNNIGINEKTDKYQDRLKSGLNDYIYPRNYQKFNNRTNGLHSTQKPVALCEYLIKTYTNENEIVLDNCIGSGTTAIAAIRTGRKFIGIEKDPEYHRLACERVEKEKLNLFNVGD